MKKIEFDVMSLCGENYFHKMMTLEEIAVTKNWGVDLDSLIFRQAVGRKDKNKIDICDGDILKHHGIVFWDKDNDRWGCIDLNWNDKREEHCLYYLTSPFIIIGNKWENPELWKETK